MKVAPKRLARGPAADLANVRLDDDLKNTVPYYLTVSYINSGSEAVPQPKPEANFTVTLSDGTPGEAISLWNTNFLATGSSGDTVEKCGKSGAKMIPAGATATVCQLVMLPKGRTPATVAYSDEAGDTLLWKVGDGEGDDAGLLDAGETADSSWKDTKGGSAPLRVTPKSIRAGTLADLGDYDLSGESKNLVPWYVTMEYRNDGSVKVLPVMDEGVGLRSAAGQEVQPLSLVDLSPSGARQGQGVDQCRGTIPNTRLEPHSTVTLCSVHLLPKGDRPVMVSFESEEEQTEPLMWRAS
ncbi:hypothetical protein ACFUVV_08625 [Streptomyces sp. NPDC057376]|uniref:hypothetical protein n=1 Tax=unclassified Streptomyces TaxID=2593676 RepID=UPI0009A0AD39|nr:hypothetical protein [Streptomyces sp. CB02414]